MHSWWISNPRCTAAAGYLDGYTECSLESCFTLQVVEELHKQLAQLNAKLEPTAQNFSVRNRTNDTATMLLTSDEGAAPDRHNSCPELSWTNAADMPEPLRATSPGYVITAERNPLVSPRAVAASALAANEGSMVEDDEGRSRVQSSYFSPRGDHADESVLFEDERSPLSPLRQTQMLKDVTII